MRFIYGEAFGQPFYGQSKKINLSMFYVGMKYIGCRKIDSTNIKCAKEKNLIKRPILG
jgi:hypothetical protein